MPSENSLQAVSPDPFVPFGIYVHWPFCQAKCPYCDFNSHVAASVDHSAWRTAFLGEVARAAEEIPDRIVGSVYFGGGTPSLMDPRTVGAVIDAIRRHWRTVNDVEITLEANPTSVEANRLRAYKDAGVNRISMGIQALNDTDLKRLGRLHSATEARTAFGIARQTFDRVSFDLIYARQDQSFEDWKTELDQALDMAADHLSLYQLTIEDETAFGERFRRGGLHGLPNEDLSADLFELTQEMTEAAGIPAYEISNHSVPGAQSRHNMVYWTGGDCLGIGPGAHGRLTLNGRRHATEEISSPTAWLAAAREGQTSARTVLSQKDAQEELLLMGLRIREGVALTALDQIEGLQQKVANLRDIDLVDVTDGRLSTTKRGRPLLNGILREILA
ncbi:radical SAM family heme chaperone HemW [Palleronia aestuarii]|nr:radical SAM family heme chaperone HemW [Palleronia aestuarii]